MPSPSVPKSLSVSVIIPTKNRPVDLELTCRSVLAQTVRPRQIIIVDQSSTDESRNRVERLRAEPLAAGLISVRLDYILDDSLSGLTDARNRAMQHAEGEIWLFLDDDVILESDFVEQLVGVYVLHPAATGVSGVVTNYKRPGWLYRTWSSVFLRGPLADDRQPVYWRAAETRSGDPAKVTRLGGGLMSFRAEAIRKARFDVNLRGVSDGEDVDFCARLGSDALLLITPRARLVHKQSPAGRDRTHWLRRHARGMVYLYHRNWKTGLGNRSSYAWLNVGYAFVATLASARRGGLDPWKAFLTGRREGLSAAGVTPPQSR